MCTLTYKLLVSFKFSCHKLYNWEMFTPNSTQFRQHGAPVDFYINAEYFHNFWGHSSAPEDDCELTKVIDY